MQNIHDKVALITGGASGIGRGIATVLARQGARLVLVDVNPTALASAETMLRQEGAPQVRTCVLDVRDAQAWQRELPRMEAACGPIQIVVANAGVVNPRASLENIPSDTWQWVFDVNVHGNYHLLHAWLPGALARGEPAHIVLTASLGAFMVVPGNLLYSATKGAVVAMAEGLRADLAGSPIGVSVLSPGLVRSGLLANSTRLAPASHAPDADADADEIELAASLAAGKDPLDTGELVLRGIRENQFWLFTHPEAKPALVQRFDEILGAN